MKPVNIEQAQSSLPRLVEALESGAAAPAATMRKWRGYSTRGSF